MVTASEVDPNISPQGALIQVKKGWRSGENLSEEKKVLLCAI
jgi:K+-transporting ATPase c subunit